LDDQSKLVRGADGLCPKGGKFYTFGDFFYGDNEMKGMPTRGLSGVRLMGWA
jgi:hypothetical protein